MCYFGAVSFPLLPLFSLYFLGGQLYGLGQKEEAVKDDDDKEELFFLTLKEAVKGIEPSSAAMFPFCCDIKCANCIYP